jgi:hypothetical protein
MGQFMARAFRFDGASEEASRAAFCNIVKTL